MSGEIEASTPRFLGEIRAKLASIRDDRKALSFSLRAISHFFKADEACVAVLPPGAEKAETLFEIPRNALWDLDLLTTFLQRKKPPIPANTLLVPLSRHRRSWAVLAIRRRHDGFHKDVAASLNQAARTISESIERRDWERIVEVRWRIDRKMMEQLRPKDLFYQILHGLRSLTRYDHSSALLIADETESHLELVAEQVAWFKGKSRQIGLKISLSEEHWRLMRSGIVFGFDRDGGQWKDWPNQNAPALARLLDYNTPAIDDAPPEAAMICAPLATRDGVLGVLKVAGRYPRSFGPYEADLIGRFLPLAAVAIQNSQRTFTLEAKMLAAERKHAIADLARGVSHDINNALGSILPLVQQMLADIQSNLAEPQILMEDLRQVEQSVQTCRRIFGGMLGLARGSAEKVGHGYVTRAMQSIVAILKDSIERQRIRLDLGIAEELPAIRARQGDLEQLFLNLVTNARDAMPRGGDLAINGRHADRTVEITIRDTGSGIPAEHLARIHEPFFTTKPNGNGLGLSICRSILWDMSGRLTINSREGEGTEVRVFLPIADA
jgi:two-component system NtrC family sensor kinase